MKSINKSNSDIINLLKFERKKLVKLMNSDKEAFLNELENYLENNIDKKLEIALYTLYNNINFLTEFVFTTLNEEEYANVIIKLLRGNKKRQYIDEVIIQMKKNNITSLPLVENFTLEAKMPAEIFIKFVEGMQFEDLYNYFTNDSFLINLLNSKYKANEKKVIINIVFKKVIDSKVNSKYKNKIIQKITSYDAFVDKELKDLIFDENPTNLSFDTIYLNFPKTLELLSDEKLSSLIRTLTPLKSYELKSFLNLIVNKNSNLLKEALDLYKTKGERPSNTIFEELIDYLESNNYDSKIKQIIKNFFLETQMIPVIYSSKIDKDCLFKASLKSIKENYLANYNEKSALYLYCEESNVNFEIFNLLKNKINSGYEVNSILFVKYAKNYLNDDEIVNYLDKKNVTFKGFNNYILYNDDTMKYICEHEIYKNFITEKIIPHININSINTFTSGILNTFKNYLPLIIDIIYANLNKNTKIKFSFIQILNINNDKKVFEFLNYLLDNNYLVLDEAFNRTSLDALLNIDNSLTEKIIIKLIMKYDIYILNSFSITELLEKENVKLEKVFSEVINSAAYIGNLWLEDLIPNTFKNHDIYLNSIITAIKEKRLIIPANLKLTVGYLNKELLNVIYTTDNDYLKLYTEYIVNNYYEISPYLNDEFNKHFIKLYSLYYGFDKNIIKSIYEEYGNTFFTLLLRDDFKYLCMQDIETINKFFDLVKVRPLNIHDIEAINWSLREGIFAKENRDIMTIYQMIVSDIQNESTRYVKEKYIPLLINCVPDKLEDNIKKTGNSVLFTLYQRKNYELFLNELFDLLKSDGEAYYDVLNQITKSYIITKRNEYGNSGNIYNDTNILFEFNEKSLKDYLFNKLVNKNPKLLIAVIYIDEEIKEKDTQIINLLNSKNDKSKLKEEGKYISYMRKRFYNFYKHSKKDKNARALIKEIMSNFSDEEILENVKKNIIFDERKKSLDEVFNRVNVKNLIDITRDKKMFNSLLEVLKKYKLLDWSNIFDKTMEKVFFTSSKEDIGVFLSTFKNIYNEEETYLKKYVKPLVLSRAKEMKELGVNQSEIDEYIKNELKVKFTPLKILRLVCEYSNIPICYKILLGEEDFNLVRTDPEPNSAELPKENPYSKFERCIDVELKAFKQQFVTIPSFTCEINLKNGKKIKVVVGNRTHPRNLTQGERTGSCMRAYGYADKKRENDLFEYCTTNVNGFHITLLDEDDNYITRASGFRAGNTAVLNQVRNSTSEKITDKEVVEAFEIISRLIADKSTIENVVSSARIALKGYPLQKLTDGNFGSYKGHRDITNKVVVLYTKRKDGLITPLNDYDTSERYLCTRLKPKIYDTTIGDREKTLMQRITAIKKCLENSSDPKYYKNIDLDIEIFNTNYKYLILGDDFYVAVSFDNKIIYDFIPLDKRCKNELDKALNMAREFIGEKHEKRKI